MSNFDDVDESITRRNVLKSIGASSVTLAGIAGAASGRGATSADEHREAREMRRIESKYASTDTVRQALRDSGAGVKARLDAEGLPPTFELDALDDVRTFAHRDGDTLTGHVVATYDDGPRHIEFHALPEAGRSFAYVDDGDVTRRFDDDGVTTMKDCSTDTYCSNDACSCLAPSPNCTNCYYAVYTERCCLYPDGSYDCEITGSDCYDDSCCDACLC